MKSNIMLLVLTLTAFVLSSCQDRNRTRGGEARPETPVAEQPTEPEIDVPGTITADVDGLPNPNQYQVVLRWNKKNLEHAWAVYRKEGDQVLSLLKMNENDGPEYIDPTVKAGATYQYLVKSMHHDGTYLETAPITIPTDIEINGPSETTRLAANRIFLSNKARLTTNENALSIEATEIFSNDGVIDLSPHARTREPGQSGQSCKDLTAKAQKAHGRLRIICHPENGTDGSDGRNGRDGAKGSKGSTADIEVKPEQVQYAAGPERLKQMYLSAGLNGLSTTMIPCTADYWRHWFYCSKPPGNGGPGEPGENGVDGMVGGNGGNTASTLLDIAENSDFLVTGDYSTGTGGLGGRGGNPGKGGPGGDPGHMSSGVEVVCPAGSSGPPGADGLAGRTGRHGEPGKRNPYCVRIGTKLEGDCHAFDQEGENK